MTAPSGSLRIGDAERNLAAERLARHFAAGRLTQTEHEERLALAFAARTGADLDRLFADLPRLEEQRPAPRRPAPRRLGWLWVPVVAALLALAGLFADFGRTGGSASRGSILSAPRPPGAPGAPTTVTVVHDHGPVLLPLLVLAVAAVVLLRWARRRPWLR